MTTFPFPATNSDTIAYAIALANRLAASVNKPLIRITPFLCYDRFTFYKNKPFA
ncbi:MAG: hypothetical protein H7832_15375 [Magnetococcus sp. DMHC-6]